MPEFNERLVEARRAAGLTQEELAAAVHVTRSTISSWERGRTYPDVNMLRKLSEALGCDLLNAGSAEAPVGEESVPEAAGETAAAPEPALTAPVIEVAETPAETKKPRPRWIFPLICVLEAVVLSVFYLFVLPALTKPRPAVEVPGVVDMPDAVEKSLSDLLLPEPKYFNRQWFLQENVPVKGEPYQKMFTRVEVSDQGSSPYWYYYLIFDEVTGRLFTLEKVDVFQFVSENTYNRQSCPAQNVWMEETGNSWEHGGGMPVQDVLGVGYIIYGTDARGNPMSFRAYLDLTEAPRK